MEAFYLWEEKKKQNSKNSSKIAAKIILIVVYNAKALIEKPRMTTGEY